MARLRKERKTVWMKPLPEVFCIFRAAHKALFPDSAFLSRERGKGVGRGYFQKILLNEAVSFRE